MPGALRGNVHWYDYGPVIGAELSDNRPALVISNDVTNRQLELCITVPMSTAMPDARFRMHHTRIGEADSWASTRQIKSVHQGLLGDLIARASPDEMNSVILSIAQRLAHQDAPGQIETIQGTFQISAGTIWDLHLEDTRGQDLASQTYTFFIYHQPFRDPQLSFRDVRHRGSSNARYIYAAEMAPTTRPSRLPTAKHNRRLKNLLLQEASRLSGFTLRETPHPWPISPPGTILAKTLAPAG